MCVIMSELEPRHGLSANKDLSVWFSVCVYVRMIKNYTNTATSSSNANNEESNFSSLSGRRPGRACWVRPGFALFFLAVALSSRASRAVRLHDPPFWGVVFLLVRLVPCVLRPPLFFWLFLLVRHVPCVLRSPLFWGPFGV